MPRKPRIWVRSTQVYVYTMWSAAEGNPAHRGNLVDFTPSFPPGLSSLHGFRRHSIRLRPFIFRSSIPRCVRYSGRARSLMLLPGGVLCHDLVCGCFSVARRMKIIAIPWRWAVSITRPQCCQRRRINKRPSILLHAQWTPRFPWLASQ